MSAVMESGKACTQRVSDVDVEVITIGTGRPLLFLHPGEGLAADSEVLALLAQKRRVIAPLHPGFGHSELPDDFKTVEDLAYFYLDFLEQYDLSETDIVGSSLGGWIAAEIAVRSTQRIRRLVLASTVGVRFGYGADVDIADIYMLSEQEYREHAYADPRKGVRDLKAMSDDELLVMSRNRVALSQFTWSPYMHNPRLKRWLHRINVPTLVLWGANDRLVSSDYGRKVADAIPQARFEAIEGCGHYPHIERPREFATQVSRFLDASLD